MATKMVRRRWVWIVVVGVTALGCGTGGPQSGGSGGSRGGSDGRGGAGAGGGAQLIACDNSKSGPLVLAAYANPADFSVNTTGRTHQHTLAISRGDVLNAVTTFTTAGAADHQHAIVLTTDQVEGFRRAEPSTAVTGPPTQDPTGHTHTIMIKVCGIP